MPDAVDKALNMAVAATQAERSERDTTREGKEDRRTVFTVRGHFKGGRSSHEAPQQENQWSRCRERSSGNGMAGFGAPGNRGTFKGSSCFRTYCQTAVSRDAGVGLNQGRRLGTDRKEQAP
jgi:hypothetical protein